jgi:hypothetical protein
MLKKVMFFMFAAAVLFSACGSDKNPEQAPPAAAMDPMEQLRSEALDELDYIGRVRHSLLTLQDEYTKAEGKIPSLGKVTVSVDSNFVLLIKNQKGSDLYETKADLRNLNPEDGGMELIPDKQPGEFPGIRLLVLSGKPGVQFLKNGKLEKEDNKLEIYMPTRPNIEAIAPALAQALMVAHKKI